MNDQLVPEPGTAVPEGSIEVRLEHLSVLSLESGDIVILRLPDSHPFPVLKSARERLMQRVPGHDVIVLNANAELAVLRPPRIEVVDDVAKRRAAPVIGGEPAP